MKGGLKVETKRRHINQQQQERQCKQTRRYFNFLSTNLCYIIKSIRGISEAVTNHQKSGLVGFILGCHGNSASTISFRDKIHLAVVGKSSCRQRETVKSSEGRPTCK